MAKCNAVWYHGEISSETAMKICTNIGINGAFLVRKSRSVVGALALSMFFEHEVYHHIITMNAHGVFCMEAANGNFSSLEELVKFYKIPRQSFIHPLTTPISKYSLVQPQCTEELDKLVDSSPIYVVSRPPSNDTKAKQPVTFPTPSPVVQNIRKYISNNEYQKKYGNTWPKPPPPVVLPKPTGRKPRAMSASDDEPKHNPTTRPVSCFEPSDFRTFSKMTGSVTPDPRMGRRHSLDDDTSSATMIETDENPPPSRKPHRSLTVRLPSISRKEKNDSKKPLQKLAQLFISKASNPRQSVVDVFSNEKKEKTFHKIENPHHTPIMCKTTFVTISDCDGQNGSVMKYQKGTEMLVKGVRIDGWWYCFNTLTKQQDWVYQDNLKPKTDQQWFEAKLPETSEDYEAYQNLNDLEFDDDDDTYCRYFMPVDNIQVGGSFA